MSTPVLEARGIVKRYGPVTALDGVSLCLGAQEIVALVGDNGAGKSTFVKSLSGVVPIDEGEIIIDGTAVTLTSPAVALEAGIDTVYQDLALAGDLSAAANIYAGRELVRPGLLGRLGVLEDREMEQNASSLLKRLGIELPHPSVLVRDLSGGQRQCVAIARAVAWASKVLILDEPTAALGVAQQRLVLQLVKRVRDEGFPVILVSHNMNDVLELADRIVVFRRGRCVARFERHECTVDELVSAITGASEQE